jgi:hypothetical protein
MLSILKFGSYGEKDKIIQYYKRLIMGNDHPMLGGWGHMLLTHWILFSNS